MTTTSQIRTLKKQYSMAPAVCYLLQYSKYAPCSICPLQHSTSLAVYNPFASKIMSHEHYRIKAFSHLEFQTIWNIQKHNLKYTFLTTNLPTCWLHHYKLSLIIWRNSIGQGAGLKFTTTQYNFNENGLYILCNTVCSQQNRLQVTCAPSPAGRSLTILVR
jgi:hypothetical protein